MRYNWQFYVINLYTNKYTLANFEVYVNNINKIIMGGIFEDILYIYIHAMLYNEPYPPVLFTVIVAN